MNPIDDRPERAELDWIYNPSAPHSEEDLLAFIDEAAATLADELAQAEALSRGKGARHD